MTRGLDEQITETSFFTLHDAIRMFLGSWLAKPDKPCRTQRAARDEGQRRLGYAQAQSCLRQLLMQSPEGVALSQTPAHEDAPKPIQVGGTLLWVVPELEVKKR